MCGPYNIVGLMSGTSVDAIDAAYVTVYLTAEGQHLSRFEVLHTATTQYNDDLRTRLLTLMAEQRATLAELSELNHLIGEAFGDAARQMLAQPGLPAVDAVASHGQTVFHCPPKPGALGHTMQIGAPAMIAEITGLPVIADFRPADMAAGGQGAPLIPFADSLLFQHETVGRAVQNIGGIANVTVFTAQ